MKQTKLTKIARLVWILALIAFFVAIAIQFFNMQFYNTFCIIGTCLYAIAAILSLIAAKKDKEHLQNIKLAKNDERLKNINILSKAKAFNFFILIFPLVLMFSSCLKIIDFKSCIIFAALYLLTAILKNYYFFKLFKEM